MYALEEVRSTVLAKKLGGPPVFHDGSLKKIYISSTKAILTIEIRSDNNPRLKKDTLVNLTLHGVKAFAFSSKDVEAHLYTIHDLDIRREEEGLHLRLESIGGSIDSIHFDSIELSDEFDVS